MKLWKKDYSLDTRIEKFTVGNDHILDLDLLEFDCKASAAHARMLNSIGVLTEDDLSSLMAGIDEILELHGRGEFTLREQDEDCHTVIENFLTEKCGDAGKKIHTGRSRNDQVLTAIRLFEKAEIREIGELLDAFGESLDRVSARFGKIEMPGYTHMQKAMPTDVKTWMGSYRAAVNDDKRLLANVVEMIDQCPLGTAAGFGVPVLDLDREMTSKELGFARVMENSMYAQMSRGKFEAIIIGACSSIMFDLNKLASDLTLYNMGEFGLVTLPDKICTGSSIMPQKRNPDVLELIRAKYHVVLGEEFKVKSLISNLISGYNRDIQLTKEPLFTAIETTKSCLDITAFVLDGMTIDEEACKAALTDELYATEKAYKLVKRGVPFREAYRIAANTDAYKKATRSQGDK